MALSIQGDFLLIPSRKQACATNQWTAWGSCGLTAHISVPMAPSQLISHAPHAASLPWRKSGHSTPAGSQPEIAVEGTLISFVSSILEAP